MVADDRQPGRYASPPCMACEVAPDYFDPLGVDPEQARDVARWRRAERTRLLARRKASSTETLRSASAALAAQLGVLLEQRFGNARGRVLSAYWPVRGEPDLRPLMVDLHAAGATIALPVVATKDAPLLFRRWTPGTLLIPGSFGIPAPPQDAEVVVPDITLAPLLGWDDRGFRLGYGGGYLDRTLAVLLPRPFTIGIGFQEGRLATIYPQPHDMPLDVILTETGEQVLSRGP